MVDLIVKPVSLATCVIDFFETDVSTNSPFTSDALIFLGLGIVVRVCLAILY